MRLFRGTPCQRLSDKKGKEMSSFQISDAMFRARCRELAQEIFDERDTSLSDERMREQMIDRAHETVDGHEWVIYNHKALMICAHCDISRGEEFLEETGMPDEPTLHSIACRIVYGEMVQQVQEHIRELME